MQHRMIMFAGSSPGAGKSTLSNYLFQQLKAQDIPVQWLYEEAFLHLPSFAPFLRALATDAPNIDLLLQAVATMPCDDTGIVITDSFVPGYHLFFGAHPPERIERYSTDLFDLLRSRQPIIIYLKADVATAYERAIQQRGIAWLERMIQRMNTWSLPLYDRQPLRVLDDVIAFDQQIDQLVSSLLERWPGQTLVLDATATPLTQLQTLLLARFDLAPCATEYAIPYGQLSQYVGRYAAQDGSALVPELVISLHDMTLVINTYWPNGTPLVAETDTRFKLQATNRWIEFDRDAAAQICGLTYWTGQQDQRYTRVGD